jgi:hypothetical protein
VVLTFALGVGANAAMFSITDLLSGAPRNESRPADRALLRVTSVADGSQRRFVVRDGFAAVFRVTAIRAAVFRFRARVCVT